MSIERVFYCDGWDASGRGFYPARHADRSVPPTTHFIGQTHQSVAELVAEIEGGAATALV